MAQRKRWSELTRAQRLSIALLGGIQVALLGAALLDIRRRQPTQVRGSKGLWTALAFVNFAGPIAYFLLGRRR